MEKARCPRKSRERDINMDKTAPKPQDYFVTDIDDQNFSEEKIGDKVRPVADVAQRGAIAVWPSVMRAINNIFYYGFKIIKSGIEIAISQLK